MTTMICGPSGRGAARVVRGGTYYFHVFSEPEMWGPEILEEKPKQPAWTKMNNDWRKKR